MAVALSRIPMCVLGGGGGGGVFISTLDMPYLLSPNQNFPLLRQRL